MRQLMLWLGLLLLVTPVMASPQAEVPPPSTQIFVPNVGQGAAAAAYLSAAGDLAFLPDGVALTNTRITFADSQPNVSIEPAATLPGTFNFYGSADQASWREAVPTYAMLNYRALYAGIDLTYESSAAGLKSTFTVAPGVDPAQIRWSYAAAEAMTLTAGDLHVTLAAGATLIERAPVAWQVIGGVQIPVGVTYALTDGHIGFDVGEYDTAHPLIIDPVLEYATFIGSTGEDSAHGVVIDNEGFAYITGTTLGTNFPANTGTYTQVGNVNQAFVVKFDLNQTGAASMVWSTVLGRAAYSDDLALDAAGHIYITGRLAANPLYPTTASAYDPNCVRDKVFVTRLDGDGQLVYSTCLGGTSEQLANGIGVDVAGKAYIAGTTTSADFPTTATAFRPDFIAGVTESFVSVIDTTASEAASLVYSSYFGKFDVIADVAADDAGNLYLTGRINQAGELPVTEINAFQQTLKLNHGSGQDAFIARFDTTQSGAASLVYASYYGGSVTIDGFSVGADGAQKIATDGAGSAYIVGTTNSIDLPVGNNAFSTSYGGGQFDVFVARFNTNALDNNSLTYATYLGGPGRDEADGLAITPFGTVHIVGTGSNSGFPLRNPLPGTPTDGERFVAKLDTLVSGDASLVFSSFLPTSLLPYDISINAVGDVAVVGYSSRPTLPLANGYQTDNRGNGDAILFHYRFTAELSVTQSLDYATAVTGAAVTKTTTITNDGPDAAASVVVSDLLPVGVDFVSAQTSAGLGCAYDAVERVVLCLPATIPAGGSVTLTTVLEPQAVGSYALPLNVLAFEYDSNPANNAHTLTLEVGEFTDLVPALIAPAAAASTDDTTPTFTWHPIPGADSYELALGRSEPPATVITRAANTYTATGDLLYATYYWRVRALNDGEYTQWSDTRALNITAAPSAAPALNLAANGDIPLFWQPLQWAVGYHVQVSRTANFAAILFENSALSADTTTAVFPADDAYGTFYWRVRGKINGTQWGSWSEPQTFTIAVP